MMLSGAYVSNDIKLPEKLDLPTQIYVQYGIPYNIAAGTDANGDGNFHDRPSYSSSAGAGVYSTRYGLLTVYTVNGNVPRNLGTMPTVVKTYMNLSRAFQFNPRDEQHPRTLRFDARSANVLNHPNVTAVQTVLSPTLGQPLTAAAARRIALGVRFTFEDVVANKDAERNIGRTKPVIANRGSSNLMMAVKFTGCESI